MGIKTGIEWTDSTWSPIRVRVKVDAPAIVREKGYPSLEQIAVKMAGRVGQHCEHVSPGCEHCYAETNNHRCLPANGTGLPYDRRSRDLVDAFVDGKVLMQPLKWKPVQLTNGPEDGSTFIVGNGMVQVVRSRRFFVENQSDLFGDWVADEMIDQIFAVMAMCPQHSFQVLTKRPERMLAYLSSSDRHFRVSAMALGILDGWIPGKPSTELLHSGKWPLPNVWLGVSAENQAMVDKRLPLLLQTPAIVRFVSCEPLLGAVEFSDVTRRSDCLEILGKPALNGVDWVICGGESGPGARSIKASWVRSLRDQCIAANVRFFFKQWGQWAPTTDPAVAAARGVPLDDCMSYFSKKTEAGCLLDDREWKQFPEAR